MVEKIWIRIHQESLIRVTSNNGFVYVTIKDEKHEIDLMMDSKTYHYLFDKLKRHNYRKTSLRVRGIKNGIVQS